MTPYGKQVTTIIGSLVLIVGAFFVGVNYGREHTPASEKVTDVSNMTLGQPDNVDFAPFWAAWKTIDERYVATHNGTGATGTSTSALTPGQASTTAPKVATNQDRVYGAIAGMFQSLGDPYTVFFPPEQAKAFQEEVDGSFSGVGMEIGIRDGALTVVAPLKDTPAYRAGIKSGDSIKKIDGKDATTLSVDVAVKQIRGKKGSTVTLLIGRTGEADKEITITRDTIVIPTISTDGSSPIAGGEKKEGIRSDGVFVIRLYNFSGQAEQLSTKALQQFEDSGSTKLLLDLRGNPGGYLESAVGIASWFVPQGKIVVSERSGNGTEAKITEHKSRGYVSQLRAVPKMVILIDRGSASASEILAGALSEYKIAKLVGERSFGKGSVQELIPITSDTEAKVTIARWYTPNGKSISESGLTPDYPVTITKADTEKKIDTQFDKAIEILNSK